jgi:hypothetical protein
MGTFYDEKMPGAKFQKLKLQRKDLETRDQQFLQILNQKCSCLILILSMQIKILNFPPKIVY